MRLRAKTEKIDFPTYSGEKGWTSGFFRLHQCKNTEAGGVDSKLEGITLDLAAIAHRLFNYSLSAAVDGEEQICDEKVNIPDSASQGVCNIAVAKGKKAARVCENGYKCVFGQRGICDFYHPEEGKSRETVC